MSSDSSSDCTLEEEVCRTELKIERDSDSEDEDSRDPLSLEPATTVTDKPEELYEPYADPVSLESSSDLLSPGKAVPEISEDLLPDAIITVAQHNALPETVAGETYTYTRHAGVVSTSKTNSMEGSDFHPHQQISPEQPETSLSTEVPTLVGLLGKGSEKSVVSKPWSFEGKAVSVTPNEVVGDGNATNKAPTRITKLSKDVSILSRKTITPKPFSSKREKLSGTPNEDSGDDDSTKKYTCLRCGFMTNLDNELRTHMTDLHPEGLKCDKLKKTQKDAITKTWKCDICNRYFPQISMLEIHQAYQHPKTLSSGQIKCIKCSHVTKDKKVAMEHALSHLPRPKSLKTTSKKASHADRYPKGKSQYACDECDYTAKKLSAMKRHSFTHTGEKPFACDLCGYTATQASIVKRHREKKHSVIEQCDSTTKENDSATVKDAAVSVEWPAEDCGKIPFITGDT